MTQEEILEQLTEVAGKALGWRGQLSADTPLRSALELDSLRLLTLVVAVEDHFHICLEEGDEAGLTTAGDLALLLQRRLS